MSQPRSARSIIAPTVLAAASGLATGMGWAAMDRALPWRADWRAEIATIRGACAREFNDAIRSEFGNVNPPQQVGPYSVLKYPDGSYQCGVQTQWVPGIVQDFRFGLLNNPYTMAARPFRRSDRFGLD